MCRLIFYIKFGKFGAIISSNRLPALFFFFFSPSGSPAMHMLVCLMVSHKSLKLY